MFIFDYFSIGVQILLVFIYLFLNLCVYNDLLRGYEKKQRQYVDVYFSVKGNIKKPKMDLELQCLW